ncbi:MAG: hypothetical protein EOP88_17125 [Verrucomicrobiaceae bacterium]|nr:MAG: hypothetical protein EOP88_17125 [Verrucomicrobiaceae bacterium]
MSDTTTSDTPAAADRKAILKSKTFWLNVLAIASVFLPAVGDFVQENPEQAVAAMGALNILIRFATKGRVNIFGENTKPPAGSLMAFLVLGAAAGIMGCLPSCSPAFRPRVDIKLRDPASGATAGLSIRPDKKVRGAIPVPVYDAETGELLGVTDAKFSQVTGTK